LRSYSEVGSRFGLGEAMICKWAENHTAHGLLGLFRKFKHDDAQFKLSGFHAVGSIFGKKRGRRATGMRP
jgi:hypothetical protein